MIAKQKQLLNKRLGLDVIGKLGIAGDELFREEDLVAGVNKKSDSSLGSGLVRKFYVNNLRTFEFVFFRTQCKEEQNFTKGFELRKLALWASE